MGILLELGMVPITYHALKAAIKNWDRVRNKQIKQLTLRVLKQCIKGKSHMDIQH